MLTEDKIRQGEKDKVTIIVENHHESLVTASFGRSDNSRATMMKSFPSRPLFISWYYLNIITLINYSNNGQVMILILVFVI